jgi:predicted dehydrogenase
MGRVVQDVVTVPTRKWARLQYASGALEWRGEPGVELVDATLAGEVTSSRFNKTRPDDFIRELTHLERCLKEGSSKRSPIAGARGLDTMLVIAAAHKSAQTGVRVAIDYAKGYKLDALRRADSNP